jgi:hypothetical protein
MLTWEEFKGITAEEWMQKALTDLKGKVEADQLQSRFGGEITMSPFLTGAANGIASPITGNRIRPAVHILVSDEKSANEKIQEVLQLGAEALWLECMNVVNLSQVLEGVYPEMIQTFVHAHDYSVYKNLEGQVTTNFSRHITEDHIKMVHETASSEHIVLAQNHTLSERLQQYVSTCLPSGKNGKKVLLHVEPNTDFLMQIAELRAFRQLWLMASLEASDLIIFSHITDHHLKQTENHVMIPVSYLILSAQFGMSDYMLDGLSSQYSEYSRLILNAQHIFQYESGVSKVEDPFAGSYVIEKLTEVILSKAHTWS